MTEIATADRLLRAATAAFARKGYRGASVREITRDAGTNLGAITYHFGSKAALFEAVLLRLQGTLMPALEKAAAGPGRPLDRIERVVRAHFAVLAAHPEFRRLLLHILAQEAAMPEPALVNLRRMVAAIATLIAEGQAAGEIRPGDPRLLTLAVMAQPIMLNAMRPLLRAGPAIDLDQPRTRSRALASAVRFVRAGLAATVVLMVLLTASLSAQEPTLTLRDAVGRALRADPAIAGARARVQQADQAVRVAASARWPEARAEATAVRFEEPMLVAPLHAIDLTRRPEFDETLLQGHLVVGLSLFDGGARGARVREARAGTEAALAGADRTERDLLLAVVAGYVGLAAAREGLAAQGLRLAALRAEEDRVARSLAEGHVAPVEAARARAALAQATADSLAAAAHAQVLAADLARRTGLETGRIMASPLESLGARAVDDTVWPGALRAAQGSSPAVREHASQVERARAARAVARADWLPDLRLEGRSVSYGDGDGDFTTEWQAGLRVSYPLWTGGRRSARVAGATAAVREAEARLEDARRAVAAELDRTRAELATSRARRAALANVRDHLSEVAAVEALALREGVGRQSDYLQAEANRALASTDLAQAIAAEVVARARLAALVGDLSPDRLPLLLEILP